MIKGPQIQLLKEHEDNFHYISAFDQAAAYYNGVEGLLTSKRVFCRCPFLTKR